MKKLLFLCGLAVLASCSSKKAEEVDTELEAEKAKLADAPKEEEQLKQAPAPENKMEAALEAEQLKTPAKKK